MQGHSREAQLRSHFPHPQWEEPPPVWIELQSVARLGNEKHFMFIKTWFYLPHSFDTMVRWKGIQKLLSSVILVCSDTWRLRLMLELCCVELCYGIVLAEEFWPSLLRGFEIPRNNSVTMTVPQCNSKQHRHSFVRNHKMARVMSAKIRSITTFFRLLLLPSVVGPGCTEGS